LGDVNAALNLTVAKQVQNTTSAVVVMVVWLNFYAGMTFFTQLLPFFVQPPLALIPFHSFVSGRHTRQSHHDDDDVQGHSGRANQLGVSWPG
jgi:hypothetical protein